MFQLNVYVDFGFISLRNEDGQLLDKESRDLIVDFIVNYDDSATDDLSEDELLAKLKSAIRVATEEEQLDIVIRTEFSNPTGSHKDQLDELKQMINAVTYSDEKISLVGHSNGELINTYFAAFDPCRIESLISVSTPYLPNTWAEIGADTINSLRSDYEYWNGMHEKYPWHAGFAIEAWRIELNLKAAMSLWTMGSQSDIYADISGMEDLAGYNNAEELNKIREAWDQANAEGKLDHIDKTAIIVDLFGYGSFPTAGGDIIVSQESQEASFVGFDNIYAFDPARHDKTPDDMSVISALLELLK